MANSFTEILVQFVFSPKYRKSTLTRKQCAQITRYIIGVAKNHNLLPIATYCLQDHIHIFLQINSTCSISQTARELKALSSKWINQQSWAEEPFQWQKGYGAFSYSSWDKEKIRNYVLKQEEHHKNLTFHQEFRGLLEEHNIEIDERYLFE